LWELGASGSFTGEIQNLTMDSTNSWYVMPRGAPQGFAGGTIDVDIWYNGTGIDSSFDYTIWSFLSSIDQNGSLFQHSAQQFTDGGLNFVDIPTGDTTISGNHSFPMVYVEDYTLVINRSIGCYWVEYWVTELDDHRLMLPAGKSEMISFGMPCPTDDSDGDGWTDTQENAIGSNSTDATSTPPDVWQSANEARYAVGCVDGGGWMNGTICVPSPWVNSDDDNYDDSSFLAGCIAGGGSISAADECTPSPWDDTELGDGFDDVSYLGGFNAGVASVNITSDNPVCDWTTQTWSPIADPQCVPISPWDDSDDDSWDDASYVRGFDDGEASVDTTSEDPDCNWPTHTWSPTADPQCVPICEDCPGPVDSDRDGVIDTLDVCDFTPPNSYVDSNGCAYPDSTEPGDGDDVDITGAGDVPDLAVVGGASLLAGIGLSSILSSAGGGSNIGRGGSKPDIDIDIDDVGDIVDDLDLDINPDLDLDLDKPDIDSAKESRTGGSDQYFKSGVERQKAMTDSADPLLDDYVEDEP